MQRAQVISGTTTSTLITSTMSSAMEMKLASLDVSMMQQDPVTIALMLLLYFVMKVSLTLTHGYTWILCSPQLPIMGFVAI